MTTEVACWCRCLDILDGELIKHYKLDSCKEARRRLEIVGLINKSEQEEVTASSAPKHNNK